MANNQNRVIALGFFDGVHLGHGALLRAVTTAADRLGASPVPLPSISTPALQLPVKASRCSVRWRTASG